MPMKVDRTLVTKDFDRYVLATDNMTKDSITLPVEALAPVDAGQSIRKAHWESRVYHNALTADPFLSQSYEANVAYFVNAEYQLIQVVSHKTGAGMKLKNVCDLPKSTTRQENVAVQVAGKGFIVCSDGHGTLHFLKAESDYEGAKWSIMYECSPWGTTPLLMLGAFYDDQHQCSHVVVAEPLSGNEDDGAFRISMARVFATATEGDMEIDNELTKPQFVTSGIAIVSEVPTYVSFNGLEVVLLVKGKHQLLLELGAEIKEQTMVKNATQGSDTSSPHKRHHDEDELNDDEMAALLSKLPRAGIGFHGEISKPKAPSELASLDFNTPLSERFHKSSTPFSSVDVPLHSASDVSTHHRKESIGSSQDRPLEMPTVESILSGFEECDSGDPNAKASLLLVNLKQHVVHQRLNIDCQSFQFLCPSAETNGSSDFKSALLFRNDVHGLIFELNVIMARLTLRHVATLPAFGFVQASKQEKKFMSFHPSGSLACIGEFGRRVFAYQSSPEEERKSHTRKQHVIELGDQQLLGMQITSENALLVLTSSQVCSFELP